MQLNEYIQRHQDEIYDKLNELIEQMDLPCVTKEFIEERIDADIYDICENRYINDYSANLDKQYQEYKERDI
ncbi:MAG: hypothetical protein ACPG9K_00960 [Poseidonibacter sp.]